MWRELCDLFDNRPDFTGMQGFSVGQGEGIQAVYASPEQLYVIASFSTGAELASRWESVAEKVAVAVQSRLRGEHEDLRWDLYLLLLVEEQKVPSGLRKTIENSRLYCRKIVLAQEDRPLAARLPLFLEVQELEEGVLFGEADFLQALRAAMPEQAAGQLGGSFFENGVRDADALAQLLIGGKDDADSGA